MVRKIGQFRVDSAESDRNRSIPRRVLSIFVTGHFLKENRQNRPSRPSHDQVGRVTTKSTDFKPETAA
jgi:hypothetical protein